jgi:ADP-heptose:LPS heptosyltransferase
MRILVLQLARLGDIYLTWPILRSLRRQWPDAQIEIVVRQRFHEATLGLEGVVDRVHVLDSADILEPLYARLERSGIKESLGRLEEFITSCKVRPFDQIINLTYSPLSSYLTKILSGPYTQVSGYSRHSDGGLFPVDEVAAYFLAQGGVGGPNRLHLLDIFAAAAGVTLQPSDLQVSIPEPQAHIRSTIERLGAAKCVAIQMYASTPEKSLSQQEWEWVLPHLAERTGAHLVLLGSSEDCNRTPKVEAHWPVIHLMGQTQLKDLFYILKNVEYLISPDSLGVHIAGLIGTPVLNLAMPGVNSFETGPWSPRSRVVRPENLLESAVEFISGPTIGGTTDPSTTGLPALTDEQRLIESLYFAMGPTLPSSTTARLAWEKLQETMQLAIENAEILVRNPSNSTALQILRTVDDLIKSIVSLAPELNCILHWYQVELTRIPPGSFEQILLKTLELYRRAQDFTSRVLAGMPMEGESHANSSMEFR